MSSLWGETLRVWVCVLTSVFSCAWLNLPVRAKRLPVLHLMDCMVCFCRCGTFRAGQPIGGISSFHGNSVAVQDPPNTCQAAVMAEPFYWAPGWSLPRGQNKKDPSFIFKFRRRCYTHARLASEGHTQGILNCMQNVAWKYSTKDGDWFMYLVSWNQLKLG